MAPKTFWDRKLACGQMSRRRAAAALPHLVRPTSCAPAGRPALTAGTDGRLPSPDRRGLTALDTRRAPWVTHGRRGAALLYALELPGIRNY
ncbi:hypothetical protein E2562_033672 [Oryza meyeriana var. granulata]|uniref:Uncharacterized protein n=1 Tax=Oryza meyeriana var. granulata TaxID=110450 RepID=A0A6G1CAR2_9ORYZ|nr:hypothetical protein E2562_033672 [Oryza meyeriana var. granulata]